MAVERTLAKTRPYTLEEHLSYVLALTRPLPATNKVGHRMQGLKQDTVFLQPSPMQRSLPSTVAVCLLTGATICGVTPDGVHQSTESCRHSPTVNLHVRRRSTNRVINADTISTEIPHAVRQRLRMRLYTV